MKLATVPNGSRDGSLVVVNRMLTLAVSASGIAPTLQNALDNWAKTEPVLKALADKLENGRCPDAFPFQPSKVMAPLPRAHAFLDGSAYINHVELVRKARGADLPPSLYTDPLMYQGCSDHFAGPHAAILHASDEQGIDFESEVCVVLSDVPQQATRQEAEQAIQLLCLINDVTLRNLVSAELAKGFGFVQSKPVSALSPVMVTPDELGNAWNEGRVHLPLETLHNGVKFGDPDAGAEMLFSFVDLIMHASQTRPLGAGTILGGGTVSMKDRSRGSSCLAEKRMIEKIETGEAKTPFLKFGDRVRIEMRQDGKTVFGAIEQDVQQLKRAT